MADPSGESPALAYFLSSGVCNASSISFNGAQGQGICVFNWVTGTFYGDCDSVLDFLPNGYATPLDDNTLLEIQRRFEQAFLLQIKLPIEFWARLVGQLLPNNADSVEGAETNAAALTEALVQEALENDDSSLNRAVRGGQSEARSLVQAYREHALVPGLFGISAQYSPGKTIEELACAGRFPHGKITVSTYEILLAVGTLQGIAITLVPSPGRGYHNTISVAGNETCPAPILCTSRSERNHTCLLPLGIFHRGQVIQ